MFDNHGRIFSYTWDTNIGSNSFAKYSNYNDKIAGAHYVWLSSNVTNVQNGALGSINNITRIYCEAPQNRISLNEYSECNVEYGNNTLSQFYILASLAQLLSEKTNYPIGLSDCSSSLQNLINYSIRRVEKTESTVTGLNSVIYCHTEWIYTITLTGDAANYFGVLNGSSVEMEVSGNWETGLTRIISIPNNPNKYFISYVQGDGTENNYNSWEKIESNPVEYYESPETISTLNGLNNHSYVNPNKIISLVLTSSAAEAFGVDSNTVAQLRTLKCEYNNSTYYLRYLTFPNITGFKWYQKVTNPGIYGWVADNWAESNFKDGTITLSKLNSDVYESTPTRGSSKLITSNGAFWALSDKMKYADATGTSFDNLLTEGKIYKVTVSNVDYSCWIIGNTQFRRSTKGLEYRVKNNNTWSDWEYAIANESISFTKLSPATVSKSTNSSQAWGLANDTTIPTVLLTKYWIDGFCFEEIQGVKKLVLPSLDNLGASIIADSSVEEVVCTGGTFTFLNHAFIAVN